MVWLLMTSYSDVWLPPLAYELYYITKKQKTISVILCCGVLYVQDVEANTVRLKEHEQAVLVLEKSPRTSTLGSIKYVCFHVSQYQQMFKST